MPDEHIDIDEFQAEGYLQELNRQFLHPLGLALEVVVGDDGTMTLGGVWDHRDDPEGVDFGEFGPENQAKAKRVAALSKERRPARVGGIGYWVQPTGVEGAVGEAVEVVVLDPDTGEELGRRMLEDDYMVLCAGKAYVHYTQASANGTHVITVKGAKPPS